jgi:hypothetical protein
MTSAVDLSALPTTLTLKVGDRVEVPLPSYAGSGNAWSVSCIKGLDVAQVRLESGPLPPPSPPGAGTSEPPPLMLAGERAVVSGLAPGEATWWLVLARSFGPPTPTAVHDLQITVIAAT